MRDAGGKQICLKERVTISDRVTQPILCYGKLMEQGWSTQASEQMLVHSSTNTRIPVDMQNRSLTVSGQIRLIQEMPHQVSMLKATLGSSLQDLPHGWHVNELGFEVGYHISNKYIDPMSYNPNYVDVFRTTLIQNAEGQWEMVEFCEDVGKMLDCDVELENPGMRGVITILTKNDVVPEAMGFQLEDEYPRSMRPKQREQAEQEFEDFLEPQTKIW